MKITAKLALNQLRKNKVRTRGALLAAALSTALTTAVCLFPASGTAMMTETFGSEYGNYKSTYAVFLFPMIFLMLIIACMSIIVISNVFRVSANERIAEFGILKCVGATEKQIKESVMFESVILSVCGIPFGIFAGLGLDYLAIRTANLFLDDLNELVHIMVNEIYFHFEFVISWKALVLSAAVSFLTIWISAGKAAHKASVISAVNSVRGVGSVVMDKRGKRQVNACIVRFFGYEGELAVKNSRRDRKNFRATVSTLSVGIILFIVLASVVGMAKQMEEYMNVGVGGTVIADYSSARSGKQNAKTGREEFIYLKPVESQIGNEIAKELQAYDNGEIFGMGQDYETYYAQIPKKQMAEEWSNTLDATEGDYCELSVEIITLDEKNYKKICEKANVPTDSVILLNHDAFIKRGKQIDFVPFASSLRNVILKRADGSSMEVEIAAALTKEEIPEELFYVNTNDVRLILPDALVGGYSWYASPKDIDGFIEYANQVLKERFPEGEDAGYMESGFSTRVFKTKDYSKVMNIAIVLILVFLYTFVILLMFIGFTNVFSTISTNVLMRDREFAVLQSIGMTLEGVKKMLCLESILCSVKSLVIGVSIGIVISYLVHMPIGTMYPIPYQIPWQMLVGCVFGVFGITLGITWLSVRKLQNGNIIETIRQQSGR